MFESLSGLQVRHESAVYYGSQKKANEILGCIKRGIASKNTEAIVPLYSALVGPPLNYQIQSWVPQSRTDTDKLESVQNKTTVW